MRLFHETRAEEIAAAILRDGFRDSDPLPHLGLPAGVWLSDSLEATAATGGSGDRLLVEIPEHVASRYLIVGSPGEVYGRWREFCIPAATVNHYPRERLGQERASEVKAE